MVAVLAVPLVAGLAAIAAPSAAAQPEMSGKTVEYNVLSADNASVETTEAAIRSAGGTVVRSNKAVGLITATAPANGFTERMAAQRTPPAWRRSP